MELKKMERSLAEKNFVRNNKKMNWKNQKKKSDYFVREETKINNLKYFQIRLNKIKSTNYETKLSFDVNLLLLLTDKTHSNKNLFPDFIRPFFIQPHLLNLITYQFYSIYN